MPFLLRRLRIDPWLSSEAKLMWLSKGEVPADPVCSFQTKQNVMSTFLFDGKTRTIEQVAAALTIPRGSIQEFEYLLFDSEDVLKTGIKIDPTEEGDTPDKELNKMHRNLKEISGQKLVKLTKAILDKGVSKICDVVLPKDVAIQILEGISSGRLEHKKISPKIIKKAKELARVMD